MFILTKLRKGIYYWCVWPFINVVIFINKKLVNILSTPNASLNLLFFHFWFLLILFLFLFGNIYKLRTAAIIMLVETSIIVPSIILPFIVLIGIILRSSGNIFKIIIKLVAAIPIAKILISILSCLWSLVLQIHIF